MVSLTAHIVTVSRNIVTLGHNIAAALRTGKQESTVAFFARVDTAKKVDTNVNYPENGKVLPAAIFLQRSSEIIAGLI